MGEGVCPTDVWIMASCLEQFEQKTVDPSGKSTASTSSVKKDDKEKPDKKKDAAETLVDEVNPFDLVVLESNQQEYQPGGEWSAIFTVVVSG